MMDLQTLTATLDQMRREVEVPVRDGDVERLTLATCGKLWRIVTEQGAFDADRPHERWIVPIPDDPGDLSADWPHLPHWLGGRRQRCLDRVYKIARVRINAANDDYTAFYDLETTRYE